MNISEIDAKFDEVIPTAILTAYPRTFSDIPYSQEIFTDMKRIIGKVDDSLLVTRIAVELEARSKILDALINKEGADQILELASGFSPRGLIHAQSPNMTYVELDLPEVIKLKVQIFNRIATVPSNLHFVPGNVIRESDFDNATSYFNQEKPVTIINEGLLRYLSFEEKVKVANSIRQILSSNGGVWISGDGATTDFKDKNSVTRKGTNTTILNQTKNSSMGDAFESREHFIYFFEQLGFSLEFHEFTEVTKELTTPAKLHIDSNTVRDKLLSYASAVVFRVR